MSTLAPTFSPERVTPIKPSEALRLGRLTRPLRVEGVYFEGGDGACALGSMLVGVGYLADPTMNGYVRDYLPELSNRVEPCPACDGQPVVLDATVIHLNDEHHWPDDPIALWLESLGL